MGLGHHASNPECIGCSSLPETRHCSDLGGECGYGYGYVKPDRFDQPPPSCPSQEKHRAEGSVSTHPIEENGCCEDSLTSVGVVTRTQTQLKLLVGLLVGKKSTLCIANLIRFTSSPAAPEAAQCVEPPCSTSVMR